MLITLFKAYILFCFFCFFSNLKAQDQHAVDSLIKVYKYKNLNKATERRVLNDIAFYYPNPDSSIKYARILIDNARQDSSYKWLENGMAQMGLSYKIKGDIEKALECFYAGLKYAQKSDDESGKASIYNAIGSIYRLQNNYDNAIAHYNAAIDIFRELKDTSRLATCLLNLGELYRLNNSLDSALIYFNESGAFFDQIKYNSGIAYNLGNIGLVYGQQGKYDSAELNLKVAIKQLEELGDRYPICVYNISMAEIYKEKGEYKQAVEYASSSYEVAMQEGFKEQVRDASQKLTELYSDLDNYEKAFYFQSQYIAYEDSIVDEETIRKMADQRTEYEVSQKQVEVDLLESEKKTQQIIVISLGVGVLLLGAVAFLFFNINQQRKAANLLLAEQKKEIESQRDQLEELNSTKDKFFSIISHDLRGPVHAFKGMSRLIKMFVDDRNIEELDEVNVHFDRSIDQLSTLLDDLLDWAVAQQGNMPYHPEKINVAAISNDLLQLFNNMARAKSIDLVANVPANLLIWADRNSMNTILRNLINNALKFTPQKGKITLLARKEEDMIAIVVADTGVGIPKEKAEKLFELGKSKSSWGTQGEKGLGLGLQLVQQFSQMNNGYVTIASEEGKGTTFTLYIPAYHGQEVMA